MPPEVSETFRRVSGLLPFEGFGQTETTLTIGTFSYMKPRPGSMGKANPQYDVHLLDADGKPVASGETGEICIKAERSNAPCGLFCSYMKSPEDTNAAWHDGFYHTGDQAWQDEDGYFWYEGRADDIIKTSGYRVGPFEVESVDEIKDYVKTHTAPYKYPRVIEFVNELPKTVNGKIRRAAIRAQSEQK